jgi:ATP-dependent Clp protease protease subunit
MVEIKLHLPISSEEDNRWMAMWGADQDVVFSLDTFQRILDENPDENDFKFNIHCDGGSVSEGLAIYDAIRTSGKNIYCNIEGGCHSMAICILLAAPKENRTANKNCRALIHKVIMPVVQYANVDDLKRMTEELEREQTAILNIYADRTGIDFETLENLMKEEKVRTADELLKYGFISKINGYNTNLKNDLFINKKKEKMNRNEVLKATNDLLAKVKNLLTGEAVNYDFTDEEGKVLFSTEAEDDTLEIGMSAQPDGTFELPDGRTVTIAEGVITEIKEASSEKEEEVANLIATNAKLRESLNEAVAIINELKKNVESNYKPAVRQVNRKSPAANSYDDFKAEIKNKRAQMLGRKEQN